jgi:hypothetical protein
MTRNMGFLDRMLRFAAAIVIAITYMLGFITATWAVWLFGVIGTIMLVTGTVGFCPLYALLGISTKEPTTHS